MHTSARTPLCFAASLLLLAACGHHPAERGERAAAQRPAAARPAAAAAYAGAPAAARSGQRSSYDSVDRYKEDVAEHIMAYNKGHTFDEKLPPMLPAIVVLRMTVDADGRLTEVTVQRARHSKPAAVALASMQRSGPLPSPRNLIRAPARTLSFSETFLFNADNKFKLRTLAGPQ
jgi:protein TonB